MGSSSQVFLAVRRMLDEISAHAPAVLILDWADPATLDLVRHLGQAHPEGRHLLLVGSYRSRELRRGEPLWQLLAGTTFLRRTERLVLPAFERAELHEFLAEASGGQVDLKLVERCLELSDGIPFYAEQLMAAGALNNPEQLELSDDMRDLILSRLDGLSAEAVRVTGRPSNWSTSSWVRSTSPVIIGHSVSRRISHDRGAACRRHDDHLWRRAVCVALWS